MGTPRVTALLVAAAIAGPTVGATAAPTSQGGLAFAGLVFMGLVGAVLVSLWRGQGPGRPDDGEAASQLQHLTENIPIVLFALDQEGRFTRCEGGALRAMGQAPADVVGRSIYEVLYSEEPVLRAARLALGGQGAATVAHVAGRALQAHLLPPSDAWRGESVGVAFDVTDRVLAERELQAGNRSLNALVSAVSHGVALLERGSDAEYRYTFANERFAAFAGAGIERITGATCAEIFNADVAGHLASHRTRALKTRQAVSYEIADWGWPRPTSVLSMTVAPVFDESGTCDQVVHVVRDITAEREADEVARRRERADQLEALVQGISHDFNNLLQAILGNVALLRMREELSPRAQGELAEVERAGARAAVLTRQLATACGRLIRTREHVNLGDLLRGVAAHHDRVALAISPAVAPAHLSLDVDAIRESIEAIIENAMEAVDGAGGEVTLEATECQPHDFADYWFAERPGGLDGGGVAVVVHDTGVGMDPGTLARAFEPFFSTKFVGRGLGLAAALGAMRAHGGTIALRSSPGVGTAVALLFPWHGNSG